MALKKILLKIKEVVYGGYSNLHIFNKCWPYTRLLMNYRISTFSREQIFPRLPKFSSPQILDTKTRKQTHQPKHFATSTSLQTVRPPFESRTFLYQHLLTIFIFTDFFHRLQKSFAGGQLLLYLCLIDTMMCEALTSKKNLR